MVSKIYTNEIFEEVYELYADGKTLEQIQEITGLKKSSVNGYLPYIKYPYKQEELGTNAERTSLYRRRKEIVSELDEKVSDEKLWDTWKKFSLHRKHRG